MEIYIFFINKNILLKEYEKGKLDFGPLNRPLGQISLVSAIPM